MVGGGRKGGRGGSMRVMEEKREGGEGEGERGVAGRMTEQMGSARLT